MKCLLPALLFAAYLHGATGPLVGQRGAPAAGPLVLQQTSVPPLVYTLAPRATTYAKWSDYRQVVRFEPAQFRAEPVSGAWLEVRQLAQNRVAARLPVDITQSYTVAVNNYVAGTPLWFESLALQHLEALKAAPPGEYQLALVVNGLRASNVVSVKIDPRYDPKSAPAAEPGQLEPPPPGADPSQLVFWFTIPANAKPGYAQLLYDPRLVVDDTPRSPPERRGEVRAGNLETPGYQGFRTIDLGDYAPPVDPDAPHTLRVVLGAWRSAPFRFDPSSQPLNRTWDRLSLLLAAAERASPPAAPSQPAN